MFEIVKKYKVDTIIHLAALLSVKAEASPVNAWKVNMNGLMNALEVAKEGKCQFFAPSSIGAFGPESPKDKHTTGYRDAANYDLWNHQGLR